MKLCGIQSYNYIINLLNISTPLGGSVLFLLTNDPDDFLAILAFKLNQHFLEYIRIIEHQHHIQSYFKISQTLINRISSSLIFCFWMAFLNFSRKQSPFGKVCWKNNMHGKRWRSLFVALWKEWFLMGNGMTWRGASNNDILEFSGIMNCLY